MSIDPTPPNLPRINPQFVVETTSICLETTKQENISMELTNLFFNT
jgi:hypothetical protein